MQWNRKAGVRGILSAIVFQPGLASANGDAVRRCSARLPSVCVSMRVLCVCHWAGAEFCKQQLWPILHYLIPLNPTSLGRFDPGLWASYVRANKVGEVEARGGGEGVERVDHGDV